MTLTTEYTAAQDLVFINRCFMAAIAFAINIIENELPSTPNHTNRANYAKSVVSGPSSFAAQLAQGVIALNSSSDGSLLTDQTIADSIADIWNMYAGIL